MSNEADCAAALAHLHELLDNELDQVSADAIRAHLAACEACMDNADAIAALKALVKRSCEGEHAPAGLVSRISLSVTRWRMSS